MTPIFIPEEYSARGVKNDAIDNFCKHLHVEHLKGKIPFIVNGSGISPHIPNVATMIGALKSFIDPSALSSIYKGIYEELCSFPNSVLCQSKFLTYIQNAYLGKNSYVHPDDLKPLSIAWDQYVDWLLKSCISDTKGLLNAEPSKSHYAIRELSTITGAISITTNFDNLLKAAFKDDRQNFYPLLDEIGFNKYFTSTFNDSSLIEIQTRGDIFWVECTGQKSKICPNIGVRCYVPGSQITPDPSGQAIYCVHCGSEAKVHFSFPGTKEKDHEMSLVMNGLWKYLAYRCSAILLVGSSLNYDPVLLHFIQEIVHTREIPIVCISRSTDEEHPPSITNATKAFCSDRSNLAVTWLTCKDASIGLNYILESYRGLSASEICFQTIPNSQNKLTVYCGISSDLIGKPDAGQDLNEIVARLRNEDLGSIIDLLEKKKLSHCSQLGLKTYWLTGKEGLKNHSRFKHSLGVLSIASSLYLASLKDKACDQELKFLQLAALLHDIGHLPFSHLMEEVFNEFNWVPGGKSKSFNHEEFGSKRIQSLLKEDEFNSFLEGTMYSSLDLVKLIQGEYGVGYLDSILNSPLDADKIEYLFSDSIFTGRSHRNLFKQFLSQLCSGLSVSENCFWVIQDESTQMMLQLLSLRGEMYTNLYLRSGLRYLEACCKLILRSFISYKCGEETILDLPSSPEYADIGYFYNLSDVKLYYVVDYLTKFMADFDPDSNDDPLELALLRAMVGELNVNPCFSDSMKTTINRCLSDIEKTKDEKCVYKIEKEKVKSFEISSTTIDRAKLTELAKCVYIRFPGVILIDHIKSKAAFSFSGAGKKMKRSDGSNSSVENILIRHINKFSPKDNDKFLCLGQAVDEIIKTLHMPTQEYINIYRITDDPNLYLQAEDFVFGQLRDYGLNLNARRG